MKIGAQVLIAMVVLLAMVSVGAAAEEAGQAVPNLIGKWTAKYKVHSVKGTVESANVLTVTEQDGPYFRGNHSWSVQKGNPGDLATQRGKVVASEKEPIIGVIDFDGRTVRIVEQGDAGRFDGRLAGKNTMELVHTEGGDEPLAYRAVFTKQGD